MTVILPLMSFIIMAGVAALIIFLSVAVAKRSRKVKTLERQNKEIMEKLTAIEKRMK